MKFSIVADFFELKKPYGPALFYTILWAKWKENGHQENYSLYEVPYFISPVSLPVNMRQGECSYSLAPVEFFSGSSFSTEGLINSVDTEWPR